MPIATLVCTLLAYTSPGIDIQVDGAGLLRFARSGRAVFAKKATLTVTAGHVTSAGCDLLPPVSVPSDAVSIDVDLEGNLYVLKSSGKTKIGKLVLAMFTNEDALARDGKFLVAQDRPTLGEAGQDLFGVIRRSGEDSNPTTSVLKPISPIKSPIVQASTGPRPTTKVAPYRSSQKIKGELPVISIRLDNEAKGDKILLGEIADITADSQAKASLEGAQIGDTPSMGVDRGIDAFTITSGLSRAGWKIGSYVLNMTQGAKVRRQCQQIEDDKFVQLALEAAKSQLKMLVPMHSDIAQPPFSAPLGEVSLKVDSCKKVARGVNVSIALYVDGHRLNSRMVQLSPDKEAIEVTQGQVVKIVAHAAGATVQLSGKAKGQAWAGQQVTVETETGAILTGTLNQDGNVEVSL